MGVSHGQVNSESCCRGDGRAELLPDVHQPCPLSVLYFSRVWTFQEMLIGKNIAMWGINEKSISCIGELLS